MKNRVARLPVVRVAEASRWSVGHDVGRQVVVLLLQSPLSLSCVVTERTHLFTSVHKCVHMFNFAGQIAIACHERSVRVLQANVLEDGRTCPASIPINLTVLFALLPAENSKKFCGQPKLSAKDILHAKDGLPKVV